MQFRGVAAVGACAAADRAPTVEPWNGNFVNRHATDLRRGPVAFEKSGLIIGKSGAPGDPPRRGTPDPLLRMCAVQNSKSRFWCRLRGSAPFMSLLNWTEVGLEISGIAADEERSASPKIAHSPRQDPVRMVQRR